MALQPWMKLMRRNVRRMTQDQAKAWMAARAARPVGIGDPEVRKLTGGLSSQNIDFATTQAVSDRARGLPLRKE